MNSTFVSVNINGTEIEKFTKIDVDEIPLFDEVETMQGMELRRVPKKYGGVISYVVPEVGRYDFEGVIDGRLTLTEEGGRKVTYTGVYVTIAGAESYAFNGENIQDITWKAKERVPE